MSRIFYPSSEKLSFLLDSIHNREVALPDFQRDFVWDPSATEELIESLCQNFPAGSLLRIKNSAGFYFKPREFAGAPPLDGHEPSYLILDGQQRLTSLYQALYGVGEHRYYMDLHGLQEGQDLEDCVFYLRKREGKKRYGTIEQQAQALVFPLNILWGDAGGFEEWLDRVLELRLENEEASKSLKKQMRSVRDQWIKSVEEYEFPMVTLEESTSPAAVCTIFETLNRTGVKLSVFDLLAARFWPLNVRLRDLWDEARAKHAIIGEFEVDPYYALQAIALFTARGAPSCKRKDVLNLAVEQIQSGWQLVIEGLAESLRILRDDCGVILPNWLPYATMLVPAAAALASTIGLAGPEVAAAQNKFKRWFWCSVYSQAYEKAPNSQAARDVVEVKQWFAGASEPHTVASFRFDPDILREATVRQRGLYRGTIALILRHEARDFHTGQRITASLMLEKKIDDHHVFPHGYLAEVRPDVGALAQECVLNRTLIDRATNIRIGKRAPSDYLAEVRVSIGEPAFIELLDSHLLADDQDPAIMRDDFGGFLDTRQRLLAAQIRKATS